MRDNYFVCTLGQAKHHPKTKAGSITEFLELQAEKYGQRSAIGFAGLAEQSTYVFTYDELNELTKGAARGLVSLVPKIKESMGKGSTAALMAHSHVVLLKAWLGLIRLGFSVLLLAPQLDKASIEHLCAQCGVEYLFHDEDHAARVMDVSDVTRVQLEQKGLTGGRQDNAEIQLQIGGQGRFPSIPYLHHSSGTSSGKPKAIPQSNAGAFAALPSIDTSLNLATFSSTPLYHGGVADCFRAWTSGQMIWLFPGGQAPITAQTVLACLLSADRRASHGSIAPIKYFSSVPYVLRDLAANKAGMEFLRQMDIVGVGGAAFPSSLGQELVDQGVNLVSRYGSAECGFLLSSYRNFKMDKDWDYLRSDTGAEHLSFEVQANGLFELVVKPGWPHMAKTNRPDGSYATADLLEKHPTKPHAWRYHSRSDAQITLVSGKKFDPEPIESAIVSKCPRALMMDVLVFGDGENYPGALIFSTKGSRTTAEELLDLIWPTINEVNQQNPSHARLSKGVVKVILHEHEEVPPLEKSSKGTILRGKALERYRDRIKQTYAGQSPDSFGEYSVQNRSDLVAAITRVVEKTTSKSLLQDQDFFGQGVDSIACIQIRNAIQNLVKSIQQRSTHQSHDSCNEKEGMRQANGFPTLSIFGKIEDIPTNILYDCGTIDKVADYLLGQAPSGQGDEIDLMKELALKYSNFNIPNPPVGGSGTRGKGGLVVVLTGATGALGTHLLDVLRANPEVERVYCLLRASDPFAAHQRVDKALKSKAKKGLQAFGSVDEEIVCLSCNLARADLGLEKDTLGAIRSTVDVIIHAAWAVNFTLRLKSFEFHLTGVQNLLNLGFSAAQSRYPFSTYKGLRRRALKFVFCSSIASISSSMDKVMVERISEDPIVASPLGYSRSKWVAESICSNAHGAARAAGVPLDVEILRIGQLCGDTDRGIWNKTEAWPLMLSTFDIVRCLPDLPGERLNWLPLNVAAHAVCEITFNKGAEGDSISNTSVYHVLNPHSTPTWATMLQWLQEKEHGLLQIVTPATWLESLNKSLIHNHPAHPSGRLLGLWKDAYSSESGKWNAKAEFSVTMAAEASKSMSNVEPVSRDLMEKMWTWIRSNLHVNSDAI